MGIALNLAGFLAISVGVAHSYLGERYILIRLFRRDDLPMLFGSPDFTRHTLRLAWHLTTVAWWGFAAVLILLANPPIASKNIGLVIGCTFLVHFLVAFVGSRGKHFSWLIFLLIGILTIYATST